MKKLISARAMLCLAISTAIYFYFILLNHLVVQSSISIKVEMENKMVFVDETANSEDHPKLPFSCEKVFNGDKNEMATAKKWVYKSSWTDNFLKEKLRSCSLFKKFMQISDRPPSSDEKAFPLAFSMIIAQNVEQFLRLFASIYHPQNIYCVTYDEKASPAMRYAISQLSACFDNVLQPNRHETIYWGTIGVLRAAVNCLQKLTEQTHHKWKYHQIVSWNDVPLKSNGEMVRVLKRLNGSSDSKFVEGQEFRYYHHVEWIAPGSPTPSTWKRDETAVIDQFGMTFFIDKSRPKSPPPGGLTIYKGSFAATLSRSVAEFIIRSRLIRNLIEWLKDTFIPDELLWATVLYNRDVLQFPSLMDGKACLEQPDQGICGKEGVSRYQIWPDSPIKCNGEWVRGSCVLGVEDLPNLLSAPQLFAHKFHMDFEPAAFFCMLQLVKNRTDRSQAVS